MIKPIRIVGWLCFLLALLFWSAGQAAASSGPVVADDVTVLVDGRPLQQPVPPLILNGRLLIGVRAVGEAVGGVVDWDPVARQVIITRYGDRLVLTIDQNQALLNDQVVTLDVPPLIYNDRTMVPLRFIGEALGGTVQWDGASRTAQIMPGPMVIGAAFRQDGRISTVEIQATGPLSYTTLKLTNPHRFVVDLPGARLAPGAPSAVEIGQGFLDRVRIAQFQKDVVRVVLDMTADPPAQVIPTERGLQVRFIPQITAVRSETLAGTKRLTFVSSLPLDATVQAVPAQNQILITVPQGVSGLPENPVRLADGTVVTIAPAAGGTGSLITVQLPYYLGHTVLSRNGDASIVLELVGSPVYGKRIWVDAGHGKVPGGKDDPGAISKVYKIYEKEINLKVALELQKLLEAAGAQVFMTRTGDEGVDYTERPALVNAVQPPIDLFVSIHHNSSASSARGTETYYWTTNPRSKVAAEQIHAAVVQALGFPDRGVRVDSFYVIKYTLAPSVLVELGYLSNADEERAIADPAYPYRAAEGIRNGIFQYFLQGS